MASVGGRRQIAATTPRSRNPREAIAAPRDVDPADQRQHEQQQHAERADAELERRIHAQRMAPRRDDSRQQQAAETHAAHERAEQHADRDRRRSDEELEQLEPDDLVDQRSGAAADEEEEEHRHRIRGSVPSRAKATTRSASSPDAARPADRPTCLTRPAYSSPLISRSNASFVTGPMCLTQAFPSRLTITVQGTTTIGP